jgi:hypothetical protein
VPVSTLQEFVAYVRANPGKLSYGSAGPGTLTHLAMEQLKVAANLDIVHVPYRGIGPAITDILGGQTQALFPGLAAALPHIKAGKMKPLAVTGTRRHPLLPDVPTFDESGYKGFDGVQWYGIVGPANLPAPIVKRLNEEIDKMLQRPDLAERLSGEALQPMPMSPDQFGQYMRDDIAKWSKLARDRGIQIGECGHRRPAGHPNSRRFRRRPSFAWLGRQRRPGSAQKLPQLGRLRDRRIAPSDRRGGAGRRGRARTERAGDDPRAQRTGGRGERSAVERHHLAHVRFRRYAS